ncbi:MAG: spore germination protein, partial [Oscillospiraceae bacterium]|nr:spore germination protein [Oscillospiraceae bacterium]
MGFFDRDAGHPHPRREPRLTQPLTVEGLGEVFRYCVDFKTRPLQVGGDPDRRLTVCYLEGVVRNERVSDYILRPLAQDDGLKRVAPEEMFEMMRCGALYNLTAAERTTTDQAAADLIAGFTLIFFPGRDTVLSYFTGTEEKRSVGQPENEPSVKGARDSFVETVRTNTAMVRRRLRAPELRIAEHIVGRQTLTPVDVLWLEGVADPTVVERVCRRVAEMDVDGVRTAGDVEEYLAERLDTPFPL